MRKHKKFIYRSLIFVQIAIVNCYSNELLDYDQCDTRLQLTCSIWFHGIIQDPENSSKIIDQVVNQIKDHVIYLLITKEYDLIPKVINDFKLNAYPWAKRHAPGYGPHQEAINQIPNTDIALECVSEFVKTDAIPDEYKNLMKTSKFYDAQHLAIIYKKMNQMQAQSWLDQIWECAIEKIKTFGELYKILIFDPKKAEYVRNQAIMIIDSFPKENPLHKALEETFTKAHKSSNLLIPLNSIPEAEDYETPKGSPNFKRKSDELDSSSYSRNIKEKNAKLPKYDWFNEDSEE